MVKKKTLKVFRAKNNYTWRNRDKNVYTSLIKNNAAALAGVAQWTE